MGARLLFVVNDPGVFMSHRLPVALAAAKAGYDVHVATPEGPAARAIEARGLAFHPIALDRRSTRPWRELRSIYTLLRLFRALKPDLVHLVTIKPIIYGGIAARLANVPFVVAAVTGRGSAFLGRGARAQAIRILVQVLYRLALGHPKLRAIFQNPDDRDAFVRDRLIRSEASALIRGSGVDPQEFPPQPEPEGPPVVALPARMIFDKGVAEFVAAARQLRGEGVSARFVLVGDTDPGNPTAIARMALEGFRDSGAVEWWGRRDDMQAVLAAAHIVCLPSYAEGLPRVLIEAALCGRPLIATDAPGCREIVRDGENGLLVPVRDAGALAAAMRRLIADEELRRKMGRRGREIALSEFTTERVVAETLALYRELRPPGNN